MAFEKILTQIKLQSQNPYKIGGCMVLLVNDQSIYQEFLKALTEFTMNSKYHLHTFREFSMSSYEDEIFQIEIESKKKGEIPLILFPTIHDHPKEKVSVLLTRLLGEQKHLHLLVARSDLLSRDTESILKKVLFKRHFGYHIITRN